MSKSSKSSLSFACVYDAPNFKGIAMKRTWNPAIITLFFGESMRYSVFSITFRRDLGRIASNIIIWLIYLPIFEIHTHTHNRRETILKIEILLFMTGHFSRLKTSIGEREVIYTHIPEEGGSYWRREREQLVMHWCMNSLWMLIKSNLIGSSLNRRNCSRLS